MTRFSIVALLAFSILFAAGSAARAQVTPCSGVLSGPTTYQNLSVPNGATCSLHDITVVGNVSVGPNATLQLGANTNIGGNLRADKCGSVKEVGPTRVTPLPILIGGNVEISNCVFGGDFGPLSGEDFPDFMVRGNLNCDNNGDYCILNGGEIGGNVRFTKNALSQIDAATIAGNATVSHNSCTSSGCEAAAVVKSTIGGNVGVNENSGPPDATLVGGNEIAGNLRCRDNSSDVAEGNDGPNTVDGKKQGQCAGL